MFDVMQSGKIILINTSRLPLQDDAARLFGRYFIAPATISEKAAGFQSLGVRGHKL
jgi:hypothetical protein